MSEDQEKLPIQVARAHLPRINNLLKSSILSHKEIEQLIHARFLLEKPEYKTCTGLDKMINILDELEHRLRKSKIS